MKSATIKLDGDAAYKEKSKNKNATKERRLLERRRSGLENNNISDLFFCVPEAQSGCGILIHEASRSHTRTHQDSS